MNALHHHLPAHILLRACVRDLFPLNDERPHRTRKRLPLSDVKRSLHRETPKPLQINPAPIPPIIQFASIKQYHAQFI